jgi:hypothetical protein
MDDFVEFSELDEPLKLHIIEKYSTMLFDFDNPLWYEQLPCYQRVNDFLRFCSMDSLLTLDVKYKGKEVSAFDFERVKYSKDWGYMKQRTVMLKEPFVEFIPRKKAIFYPSHGFLAHIFRDNDYNFMFGIINQSKIMETKWFLIYKDNKKKLIEELSSSFLAEGINENHNINWDWKDKFLLKRKVELKNGGFVEVDLDAYDGLTSMMDVLRGDSSTRPFDDYFYYHYPYPISYQERPHYTGLQEFSMSSTMVNNLFTYNDITPYLKAISEDEIAYYIFYVPNGYDEGKILAKNMKYPHGVIPLTQYIEQYREEDDFFNALGKLEGFLLNTISTMVEMTQDILLKFNEGLMKEIERRMSIPYFTRWANEKSLVFNKEHGDMKIKK